MAVASVQIWAQGGGSGRASIPTLQHQGAPRPEPGMFPPRRARYCHRSAAWKRRCAAREIGGAGRTAAKRALQVLVSNVPGDGNAPRVLCGPRPVPRLFPVLARVLI